MYRTQIISLNQENSSRKEKYISYTVTLCHFMCMVIALKSDIFSKKTNLYFWKYIWLIFDSFILSTALEILQTRKRRIYIANFAIFKIATFWSYHLHFREKSWSFSFTKLRDFLVGSGHVRSQATVHAFMHAAHAVCMRAEDIDTRFKERA